MLVEKLRTFIQDHGFERTYCIAYSGGLDSQVLLHLCAQLRQENPFSLRAIHVHHGLSAFASQWAALCEQSCQQLAVPLVLCQIDARPPAGESLEAYARKRRYELLAQSLAPQEILLTAHHQDDQAETLMLQLLRGAGPKGLSAMPELKPLGLGMLARPLLEASRAELRAYAEKQQLSWVEDESNQDSRYSRNFIRQAILPPLRERWPTVTATLARVAMHCGEAQHLLDEYADHDLAQSLGSEPNTLSVKRLLELSPPRQRLIIRRWLEQQGLILPNAAKLHQIQTAVLAASRDAVPCVLWGGIELRRYQDNLYVQPSCPPHDTERVFSWDLQAPLTIPGVGELQAVSALGQGLCGDVQTVQVRFRQGGEVYALPSDQHHELKKFFQERGIPPWLRDRLPLLWINEELAAIPGYLLVDKFKAGPEKAGFEIKIA